MRRNDYKSINLGIFKPRSYFFHCQNSITDFLQIFFFANRPIGKEEDLQKVSNTILAMKKIASRFKDAEIDTLIIISPHMLIYPDRFSIAGMKKLFGSFAQFSQPDLVFEFEND